MTAAEVSYLEGKIVGLEILLAEIIRCKSMDELARFRDSLDLTSDEVARANFFTHAAQESLSLHAPNPSRDHGIDEAFTDVINLL